MNEPLFDRRYRLLEQIGTGGEARVFRAEDRLDGGREVAIRLGLEPGQLSEANVSPTPYDPGWVRLLGTGTDPVEGAYFVLELLRGKTLGTLVESAPLDLPQWTDFVKQSMAAVNALHESGWVHGDLHAENFLFDEEAKYWKLLELPFLRFQSVHERSALFGSIHTLAPEQIDGAVADQATDFYSLGCLYYKAASGQYPQAGQTEAEIAIARLRAEPEPLRDIVPGFPADFAEVVMSLLSRKPGDRLAGAHLDNM